MRVSKEEADLCRYSLIPWDAFPPVHGVSSLLKIIEDPMKSLVFGVRNLRWVLTREGFVQLSPS